MEEKVRIIRNEKWLTDVTEFKLYEETEVHKLYPSAISDLCDRHIVPFMLSERNDSPLVFKTFDRAIQANSDVQVYNRCENKGIAKSD